LFGVRREFRENLKTKDHVEAKRKAPEVIARLGARLDRLRAAAVGALPAPTARDIAALAGVWYRAECETYGDNPGRPEDWAEHAHRLIDRLEQFDDPTDDATIPIEDRIRLRPEDRAEAAALMQRHGYAADDGTITRLGKALFVAKIDVAKEMERRAEGDWSPDITLLKIPALPDRTAKPPVMKASCTFDTLLAGWAADHGMKIDTAPIPRALYDRKRTLARLGEFLGHTEASTVTQADAVRWKEDMQRRELHASTIRNDLSEMSAVWTWGIRNGKLTQAPNPFTGISPPKARKKGREPRAFSDAEAALVLQAAREKTGAMRWLPWLACLTGTRISEICQADKSDVVEVDGVWVIHIHDDGDDRSLKNEDSRRTIPIHPALVLEGFLRYVASLPAGSPLFPDIPPDATFGLRGVTASKRVGRWVRSLGITDPRISPNHSWRHWFIGSCRRVAMHVEVRSALTGHSARMDESAGYGDEMKSFTQVLADAIAKVPCPVTVKAHNGAP
jgi:integrase